MGKKLCVCARVYSMKRRGRRCNSGGQGAEEYGKEAVCCMCVFVCWGGGCGGG
jgi:hypothetical protein